MTSLLDASVLIALTVRRHEHHERALDWLVAAGEVAGCPVVEGALVRFLVRTGDSAVSAASLVAGLRALPSYAWWADDVSYADLDLDWVSGHRQVTDAYLVGLARSHAAVLATLDERLARVHPEHVTLLP